MGHQPMGPPTAHLSASYGPDASHMKFYSTTYSTSYATEHEPFTPREGKHVGTGYQSNFRPGVYYSRRLDQLDNPAIGKILEGNYNTITKVDFKPSIGSSGKDRLPDQLTQRGSGFTRQDPITYPTVANVRRVCVDTRDHSIGPSISGVLPKHRAFLDRLKPKDPVSLENSAHGPSFMSTENKERYRGTPTQRLDTSTKTVGTEEGSGFTHAYNVEPITFHPGSPHKNEHPGFFTHRPTGVSIMKTHYLPSRFMNGDEKLPVISHRSVHDTGFTHEKAKPLYVNRVMADAYTKLGQVPTAVGERTQKGDSAEYLNMTHPDNHSTITKKSFEGQQRPTPTEGQRLERFYVGNKELSGYSDNNDKPQVQIPIEPYRWVTHYDTRFYDMNPKGKARAGRTFGNIQGQLPDGFTKSTAVHSFGPDVDTTEQLRRLNPYVARSIKARDRYYDDHTHDAKKTVTFNNLPQVMASV